MRREPSETPMRRAPGEQMETERLERPQSGNGWRISAVVIATLLVGVAVAGRLGMEPERPAGPRPSAIAAASPAAEPAPTSEPGAPGSPAPTGPIGEGPPAGTPPLPLATRYADGIPTFIDGERVLRLANALSIASDAPFLVGGWYMGPECGHISHGVTCPFSRLADSPADLVRRGRSTDLVQLVEPGTGARVLRVMRDEDGCVTVNCAIRLQVEEVVWSGDPLTAAGPIGVVPLLSALSYAFQEMQMASYNDLPQCPVPWPPQTYHSTGGGPSLTLIFPTVQDRLDSQAAVRVGRSLLLAEQGGDCLDRLGRRGSTSWISVENVMMLIERSDAAVALAHAAVSDALASGAGPQPEVLAPAPITTWQALRRLWRVEPTLDLVAPHEQQVCVIRWPAEAYALRHPHLQALFTFTSRADRREFERSAQDGVMRLLGRGCQPQLDRPRIDFDEVEWIGFENVLLAFDGPDWLQESVKQALRGTGTP